MSHGHSHDGGCSHEAIPDVPDVYRYDMCSYIDFDKVTVLNEAIDGSGKKVFKSMERKDDKTDYVDSDCDAELLFNIPFSGHVRITGLSIVGEENETHPAKIRIFKDKEADHGWTTCELINFYNRQTDEDVVRIIEGGVRYLR